MPKTIKFNLILDGKPIRDIEGLQENFCIDDVLEVYENGLLEKWLKVRGFDEYLEKVKKIKKDDGVIKQLVKIFEIKKSEKEIMEGIYSLSFWNERKIEIEEWVKKDNAVKQIVADYHNGYDTLKQQIIEHKFDMPFLKQTAKEIYGKYFKIFEIDYKYFFDEFIDSVPLMIFSILMNENLRDMFLKDGTIKQVLFSKMVYNNDRLKQLYLTFIGSDIKIRQQKTGKGEKLSNGTEVIDNYNPVIVLKHDDNEFEEVFLNNTELDFSDSVDFIRIKDINDSISLSYFSGQTEGYWKDLEPKNKKFMIISMEEGNFVRNAAKQGEELSASDVNGHFPILNGIDYKSNNADHKLIYMEV